jgi:hypothetical protein
VDGEDAWPTTTVPAVDGEDAWPTTKVPAVDGEDLLSLRSSYAAIG